MGVSGCLLSTVQKTWNKVRASVIKRPSYGSGGGGGGGGGWIKASCSESMRFCKININISNVINTFFSLPLTVVHGSRFNFHKIWPNLFICLFARTIKYIFYIKLHAHTHTHYILVAALLIKPWQRLTQKRNCWISRCFCFLCTQTVFSKMSHGLL